MGVVLDTQPTGRSRSHGRIVRTPHQRSGNIRQALRENLADPQSTASCRSPSRCRVLLRLLVVCTNLLRLRLASVRIIILRQRQIMHLMELRWHQLGKNTEQGDYRSVSAERYQTGKLCTIIKSASGLKRSIWSSLGLI